MPSEPSNTRDSSSSKLRDADHALGQPAGQPTLVEMQAAMWAIAAAFGCYFCTYMFRKPFTAATYAGEDISGLSFKTLLLTSQVAGYMVSKFIGVKLIAEMRPSQRPRMIFLLIILSELALILFGFIPRPYNAVCLFVNGLPLGMVFGLVLGQLEGRRSTELLTAGLCTSFILADGVTKTVGGWLLQSGISEAWMPSLAGALFLPPLAICVAMLARVQPPSALDAQHRSERVTLDRGQRWALLRRFAVGLVPLTIVYLAVTILRSIRADFAPELWASMGVPSPPAIFTYSETWVALLVVLVNGSTVLIRDNALAFRISLGTCVLGMLILAGALIGWQSKSISPFAFMVLLGQGLYLPYVAVHCTIFERLLAMTRASGNIGFLMYVVDSVGYLGYVAVMLIKNFGGGNKDAAAVLGYYTDLCWVSVVVSLVCLTISWVYFSRLGKPRSQGQAAIDQPLPASAP